MKNMSKIILGVIHDTFNFNNPFRLCISLVISTCVLVLISNWPTTQPIAVIGLMLLALSLHITTGSNTILSVTISLLIMTYSLITILIKLTDTNVFLLIDLPWMILPSTATSITVLFLACAMILLSKKTLHAELIGMFCLMALSLMAYQLIQLMFYSPGSLAKTIFDDTAILTAFILALLSCGILMHPKLSYYALVISSTIIGQQARISIIYSLIAPILVISISSLIIKSGLLHFDNVMSLSTMILSVGFASILGYSLQKIHQFQDQSFQSVEKFKRSFDNSPIALLLVDISGNIVGHNKTAEIIFGYDKKTMDSLSVDDLVPMKHRHGHAQLRNEFNNGQIGRRMAQFRTVAGLRADGTEVPLEITLTPLGKDENNNILVNIIDISDKKNAWDLNERLAAIVNSSNDAIISKSLDGAVTSWNKGAEVLFGYTANEIVGKPSTTLFPPDRAKEEEDILENVRKGTKAPQFETELITKFGSKKNMLVSISPIYDQAGNIIGSSKIAKDMTERDEILLKLKKSNEELERFAFVASHDMQEPLRKIMIFGKLLYEKTYNSLPVDGKSYLEKIIHSTERMHNLINDVLSYSRISQGSITSEKIDLNDVVNDVIDDIDTLINEYTAAINVDKLPSVYGDKMKLKQVFSNLITNSIKYSKKETSPIIHISSFPSGNGRYHIKIKDNGIGFSMEFIDKIFQPFGRLHSQSEIPGSGIGLAICKRIIEGHGSQFAVVSAPGDGAEFSFILSSD